MNEKDKGYDEYLKFLPALKELIEKKISPGIIYSLVISPYAVPTEFYQKKLSKETIELLQKADWDKLLYRFSKIEIDTILSLLSSSSFGGETGAAITVIKSERGRKWLKECQQLVRGEK